MPLNPITHPSLLNHHQLNPKGNKNQEGLRRRILRFLSLVPSDPINVEDEAINEEPSMQQRVLDLENTKTAQAQEITSLKKRVKKSARVVSSEEASLGDQEDASKQGRKIHDIDVDEDITLENVHDAKIVDEVTLAQALAALKSAKVQEKRDVIKEPSVPVSATSTKVSNVIPTTVATTITGVSSRPRAKGIVFHEQEQEQEQDHTPTVSSQQPTQVKDKAEEDEEESLAREKAQKVKEANIAWDDIQAKVEADYQLAQRLQAQEQEKLSDAEKATLFVQLLEKRRKHYATKRVEEKRNRPPTKAQQRSFMCTYLKNMEGWKPKDLKNKSFANIQDLFDKAMKRVNTFVYMDTELVKESSKKAEAEIAQESSSKRAGEALEQESSKKQKNILYYLLVKKIYLLTKHTLHQMFNDVKLQVDYECEMAFELLRLVKKQLKERYGKIVGIKSLLEVTAAKIQRISLTGFPAQSVGSSNTDVLDLPCLLVLITGTSQSRQHVDTSLIHIESRKSPTKSLFDVGSSRISIFTVNTLSITQMFWQNHKDNA
ncbi:hypothetical protein Tco_0024791 [Tanacetum coccineum]